MSTFSVWAPDRERIELVLDDRRLALAPVPARAGWWSVDVPDAAPGTRYRYSLDGGDARPDPRSPWQPEGIEGPSATVDHGAFAWSDAAWRAGPLAAQVLYELHVGTFSSAGTFDGAIEHLDHLVELGVTAVELLPVAEASGSRGWGYDGVLLWAPHHAYGGPDGLKRLVDACHARGLAVVLDVVYNHLGPAGNYLPEFGPYFTHTYSTPWGDAINYDGPGSDEVRAFAIGNALMWLEQYHFDGLRIDAVHAIHDEGATHLLEELAADTAALSIELGRELWLIAESDLSDPRLVRPREAGGYGLTAAWSDDFHHALHTVLTGERSGYYEDFGSLAQLARALERTFVYAGEYMPGRGRRHGRPADDVPQYRFLGYLQNHDQIGNRALGERTTALVPASLARIGAALVLLSPFVPMLFQGEEWGASTPFQYFTDHGDPELGEAVSAGRRSEFRAFGWRPEDVPDPQDPATFERSRLDWAELEEAPHAALLDWHRRLIALRRSLPVPVAPGRVRVEVDEERRTLVLHRGPIDVAINLGDEPRVLETGADGLLLASDGAELADGRLTLPARSVVVVEAPRP
jgi:maltooligosyltrehalose trehalohydrolase